MQRAHLQDAEEGPPPLPLENRKYFYKGAQ